MVPRAYITAWRSVVPWQTNEQVEQDLVISRALVEIFSDDLLREHLAFRGGTALYKLYFTPAVRYSEDIDLIQIKTGPIGPIFDRIKEKLKFLDEPQRKQKNRNNILLFRFESEIPPVVRLRLKIEINCREHFTVFGIKKKIYAVDSRWFTGKADLTTFNLEELLGSKLRALYQRKQGRDLFDLWYALNSTSVDANKVVSAFHMFMESVGASVTRTRFVDNLMEKIQDRQFLNDTTGLIRPGINYDPQTAVDIVLNSLVFKLKD